MSDGGERTCPLCAEEMDLTDQQLKPCKCGYEICVWCWHHIMDMAEKDDTGGRCPACRSAYDREKIVGMASNCERLVAEVNMEKKIKSQKAKVKSSEGRKQLSSVRVIQRNLVYIVGLPLNVADEDILQRREYFGQYGKVLKVSMSRTTTGHIQQFPNNTCSVYITYSKEEEAIRCIQNVHQFVLEGKSLRACFGTTKYCHAWLRNVPCTNPDCLYLHEIGSQEDSFTKDEIISAYTRSRVQQITGSSNSLQRRSGNMLPAPVDDSCNNSFASIGKPIIKNASNSAGSIVRGSPPNGNTTQSVALPAAASWGTRGSSCLPPSIASSTGNAPAKLKPDTVSNTVAFSGASADSTFHPETGKKPIINDGQTTISKIKPDTLKAVTSLTTKYGSYPYERLDDPEGHTSETLSCQLSSLQELNEHNKDIGISPSSIVDFFGNSQERNIISDVHINKLCSDISSMGTDIYAECGNSDLMSLKTSVSDKDFSKAAENNQGFQEHITEQFRKPLLSTHAVKEVSLLNGDFSRDECDWTSRLLKGVSKTSKIEEDVESFSSQRCNDPEVASQSNYLQKTSKIEEDVESFSSQRRNDPEVVSQSIYLPALSASLNGSNQVGSHYSGISGEAYRSSIGVKVDFLDGKFNDSSLLASNIPVTANVYSESFLSSSAGSDDSFVQSLVLPNEGRRHIARHTGNGSSAGGNYSDKGESSIISNILSMDSDVWNDSLASPQNLAKLLKETEKQSITSSPRRIQNNSQSRFSFARQEESRIQDLTNSPLIVIGQLQKSHSFGLGISENDHAYADKFRLNNGSYSTNYDGSEYASSYPAANPFNNFSAPPRTQVSAPPGFSVPNKAPPPGFSSRERLNHVSDSMAGNHLHDSSSLLRNIYQASQAGNNVNTSDLEFMDPAILAVGKGRIQLGLNNPGLDMRSNFTSQSSAFESDPRVQLLMQRPASPQQNLRFSDVMDGFNHISDSYGLSSRLVDQSQAKNLSQFSQMSIQHPRNGVMSNGHWDSWSVAQNGNNMGMPDLLRNDRVGFNKFYSGFEDSKFRMPSSGDLYNRTFGM